MPGFAVGSGSTNEIGTISSGFFLARFAAKANSFAVKRRGSEPSTNT